MDGSADSSHQLSIETTLAPDDRRRIYRDIIRPGLARGYFLKLVPRHPLYLFAPNGGGDRLARLFHETWRRVPLGPRRAMLGYWRTEADQRMSLTPTVDLLNDWSSRRGRRGLRGDKAETSERGCKLRFWTKIIAVYPDELVLDLIAHELAHVYQWAVDAMPTDGWDAVLLAEEDADFLMESWGFSATAMDDWDLANDISRPTDLDTANPASIKRAWRRLLADGR
jgi:hypothetical protein